MTLTAPARSRKEETRLRILETASRLFQEKGVTGVGVDEIMRESGLTHGGFYAHFENKEALVQEACIRTIDMKFDDLGDLITSLGDDRAFGAFLNKLLKGGLRTDNPTCPIALLGPEIARRESVQKAYAHRTKRLIDLVAKELDCPQEQAILAMSALVGATMFAMQSRSDGPLAKRILISVREELLRCREACEESRG